MGFNSLQIDTPRFPFPVETLMNNQDANPINDAGHKETMPANKFALSKWIRRFLFLLAVLAALWMIADFVYSRVVARNLANWEESIERRESGIQIGGEPFSIGNETCDVAILMIHGINETPHAYQKIAPAVSNRGLYCRAMLVNGFGMPLADYRDSTIDDWLSSVDKELLALKKQYKTVILAGHSLGGAIAIQYALLHPDSVDGLILAAPAIGISDSRSPFFSVKTWHSILNRTLVFSEVTQSPFGIDAVDKSERQSIMRMPFTPRKVIDQTFEMMDRNHNREKDLRMPVLMLLAKQDKVIDNNAAKNFFNKLPNAKNRMVEFENSAHAILVDFDWPNVAIEIAKFAKMRLNAK